MDPVGVSKEDYLEWEQKVVAAFYEPEERSTSLVPAAGAPSVLSKQKVLLVVDSCDATGSGQRGSPASAVAASAPDGAKLRSKDKIKLWHIGKQVNDGVSIGHAEGTFLHPACDIGGLTNYRQKVGAAGQFVGDGIPWPPDVADDAATRMMARSLKARWCEVAGRPLPESLADNLVRWLSSLTEALPEGCVLRFHALPPEHRVMALPSDVVARTGR